VSKALIWFFDLLLNPTSREKRSRDDRCFHKGHWLLLQLTSLDCFLTVGLTHFICYKSGFLCGLWSILVLPSTSIRPTEALQIIALPVVSFKYFQDTFSDECSYQNRSVWSNCLTLRFDVFYLLYAYPGERHLSSQIWFASLLWRD